MVLLKTITLISVFTLFVFFGKKQTNAVEIGIKLPSSFPRCHREDPEELNKCLLEATDVVRPYLAKGVPELNVPPFEPYLIDKININHPGSNLLRFNAVLLNFWVHGLTNYNVTVYTFDIPTLTEYVELNIPNMHFNGDLSIEGKILNSDLIGNGTIKASAESCEITILKKYEYRTLSDGKRHILPTFINGSLEVEGPHAQLAGLFDHNKQLNEAFNKVIKDNVKEFFEEIKPVITDKIIEITRELTENTLMKYVAFDDLF